MSSGKSGDAVKGAGRGWYGEPGMGKAKTSRRGRDKKIHLFFFVQVKVTSQAFQREVVPESK